MLNLLAETVDFSSQRSQKFDTPRIFMILGAQEPLVLDVQKTRVKNLAL